MSTSPSRGPAPAPAVEPVPIVQERGSALETYVHLTPINPLPTRFLDCSKGGKTPGLSLLDVGVARALGGAGFDEARFLARGGIFEWQKPSLVDEESETEDGCGDPKLTW